MCNVKDNPVKKCKIGWIPLEDTLVVLVETAGEMVRQDDTRKEIELHLWQVVIHVHEQTFKHEVIVH